MLKRRHRNDLLANFPVGCLRSHLFQCLFPAVRLVTERTLELFGHGPVGKIAVTSLDVPLTHLFLQMLLQAGLVGKFSGTVGTLQ